MIRNVLSKTLPFVAAVALLYPGIRKVFNGSWREELGATYQLGGRDFGPEFFLVIGLVELTMIVFILWPKTRVPAGLAMAGFFVGALIFNLGLRIDSDLIPDDQATLSTLIPLDISHLLLGLAIAALWQQMVSQTARHMYPPRSNSQVAQ